MTKDIFSSEPNPSDLANPDDATKAALATKLEEIKNESGEVKYATIDVALDALKETQSYIPNLKKEKEELEAEVQRLKAEKEGATDIEDVVKKLLANRENEPVTKQESSITEEDVAKMVRRQAEQNAAEAKAEANRTQVTSALIKYYGTEEKAEEEIAKKATELGTTPQKLGQLAKESPAMVLKYFETPAGTKPASLDTSTVNTTIFQKPTETPLEKPEKSLLSGATAQEQKDYLQKVKADVYTRLGVET